MPSDSPRKTKVKSKPKTTKQPPDTQLAGYANRDSSQDLQDQFALDNPRRRPPEDSASRPSSPNPADPMQPAADALEMRLKELRAQDSGSLATGPHTKTH